MPVRNNQKGRRKTKTKLVLRVKTPDNISFCLVSKAVKEGESITEKKDAVELLWLSRNRLFSNCKGSLVFLTSKHLSPHITQLPKDAGELLWLSRNRLFSNCIGSLFSWRANTYLLILHNYQKRGREQIGKCILFYWLAIIWKSDLTD